MRRRGGSGRVWVARSRRRVREIIHRNSLVPRRCRVGGRLCIEDERPFPNFVLIDSPLLVYEEPDADESSFPQDIKKHFWESVKTSFTEAQVIIIENSQQLPGDGMV